ncbi:hypothetical protein [Streptomyces cellulosae]|uniref:hypothetical protein n=1 Tax=Streptomyces cellulosae TaxID=1968 RepID=UPI0004CAD569|nr:hypothetical protein [Streptomyces cellulosae]
MNLRLLALAGVAACVVALPLAVASAGQVGDEGRPPAGTSVRADALDSVRTSADAGGRGSVGTSPEAGGRASVRTSAHPDERDSGRPSARADAKAPPAASSLPRARTTSDEGTSTPFLLGLGLATAARCGPELTSPDGIEAQTCVLTQGEESWARTYYRNTTGDALDADLSLLGPGGRAVQIRCPVAAEDEPGTCETPRERTLGDLNGYSAVTEFAARGGDGPLLLRSGSNSGALAGS